MNLPSPRNGRIVHVNIPCRQIERAQGFYRALFGWSFTPNTEGYVLFSDNGGIGGGLTTGATPSETGVLFFIQVDDIAKTLAEAGRRGASVVTDKRPVGGPGFYAVFADPEGNRVGLFSDR
ncbi:VOC family protein [Piscinibacter sakaiensis]|uniref:VOC family protein n=1 Tax=Piscinibacter sakaiensis TaxID=1547922 RepID=UPI003AB0F905